MAAHEAHRTGADDEDILEFQCIGGQRPPRRIAVPADTLDGMSERDLYRVYRRALPIGADHYGRPGKHMPDSHQ